MTLENLEGFSVLEEAALLVLGRADELELLRMMHRHLVDALSRRTGDVTLASQLGDKFLEIIVRRRKEIELASGSNPGGLQ